MTNLASKIQNFNNEEEAFNLINHFPIFLWVLRDFVLDLQDEDGNEISPDQYLEMVLEENYSDHPKAEEHNAIRATIKRFFPERFCCTLIRPVDEEYDLQSLSNPKAYLGENSILKPDFVEQVSQLREFIFSQMPVKSIGNIGLRGIDYIHVVEKYIEAINQGAIPMIDDSYSAVINSQLENGYNRAIFAYEEEMNIFKNESFPCNENDLLTKHNQAKQEALDIF